MTKFETIMTKLEEKVARKFVKAVKYYSIFSMGMGVASILDYGFHLETVLIVILSAILLLGTSMNIKAEEEE